MLELSTCDDLKKALDGLTVPYLSILFYSADNAPCINLIQIMATWDSLLQSSDSDCPVSFSKVNVEHGPELCKKYNLTSLPTVIILSKDQDSLPLSTIEGYDPLTLANELSTKCRVEFSLRKHILPCDMVQKLDALVKKSPIMLFIKGSPDNPRCGFTRKLIALLAESGISTDIYDYFDILSNESVRQSLKIYSDWPTYPQIFVNGEFVGGLDVVTELLHSQPSIFDAFRQLNT